MKAYIGIDPGQKGGMAMVSTPGKCSVFYGMPDTVKGINSKLAQMVAGGDVMVILEKSQSMPKQGVASSFSYGSHYGSIVGILTALEVPYAEVRPSVWKKEMMAGILDKSDKGAAILRCEQLFPSVDLVLPGCRKPSDGVAEAILLAAYGLRLNL